MALIGTTKQDESRLSMVDGWWDEVADIWR